MTGLLFETSNSVIWGILQITAGCLLAFPAYRISCRLVSDLEHRIYASYLVIIAGALCGIILPMGIYGLIPIIAVTTAVVNKAFFVLPLLYANMVFNMLVPLTEPTFMWHSSIKRIIFAFAAGVLAGVAAKGLNISSGGIFRRSVCVSDPSVFESAVPFVKRYKNFLMLNVNHLGIFLIIGAVVNSFFYRYIYTGLLSGIYANPLGSTATRLLMGYNITTDFFLIATIIINMFMDFTRLSVLLYLFNLKGLLVYYFGYFSIWVVLLTLLTIWR